MLRRARMLLPAQLILAVSVAIASSLCPASPGATAPANGEPPPAEAPAAPREGHEMILTAIREKRLLTFAYDQHPRTVEPHAYGRTREGRLALRAYQTAGGSKSAPPPGWRLFHVDDMQGLTLTDTHFAAAREDFARGDPSLVVVIAEVE